VKRWRCTICGYIHDGDQPPYQCPICRAPAALFEEIEMPDLEGSGQDSRTGP
jgi:ferredoxin hydrogenase